MKKVFAILLLAVFFVAFGAGYLLTVPAARADYCPCTDDNTCAHVCCPLGGRCQLGNCFCFN